MAHLWLNRFPIVAEEDKDYLDHSAAIHEFREGLPKPRAEEKAHSEYLKGKAKEAAAHHLHGLKSAVAAGNTAVAEKHGAGYSNAMVAAGKNPMEKPPEDVEKASKELALHEYKAHPTDSFWSAQHKKDSDHDEQLKHHLGRLVELKQSLDKKTAMQKRAAMEAEKDGDKKDSKEKSKD